MIGRSPLGYVIRIDANEITLNILDQHRGMVAGHSHGVSSVAEIGSLLGIDSGDRLLLLRITSLSFAEPKEAHRHTSGGKSLDAEPLRNITGVVVGKVIRKKECQFEFIADSQVTPALGAMVYPLISDEQEAVLGRFADSITSLNLGTDMRSNMSVNVDLQSLISKHVAVLGSSGQGKSCFTAAVLQQVAKLPRARVVIFDINGEYSDAFSNGELDGKKTHPEWVKITNMGGKGLKIPYFALGRHGLQRLLMPSEKTQRPALGFALEALSHVKYFEQQNGIGLSEDEQAFLFDDCRVGGAKLAYDRLKKLQDKTATKVQEWPSMKALSSLVAEGYSLAQGRNGVERNAFQYGNVAPLINRINRFTEDLMFTDIIAINGTSRNTPLNWKAESTALVEEIFGSSTSEWRVHVVDLRRIAHDLMPFILGSLLEMFAFELFQRGQDKKIPTLLVLEEAHHYLRPVGDAESDTGSSLAYERLAKEGRKFGLALWLSTQRPSEISQTVLSQCGNWISFKLTSEKDLAAVQAASEWADRKDVRRIAGLGRQSAIAFGESLRVPVSLFAATANPLPKSSDALFSAWAKQEIG